MDGMKDLVINIAAAILVFAAGAASREVMRFIKTRRDRTFWGRQLLRGRTFLFIGAFERFKHLEPSGFVGLGDVRAKDVVTAILRRNGAEFQTAYSARISEDQLHENMVLLGFDDTNSLTVGMLERLGSGFSVDCDAMTISDLHSGNVYSAEWDVEVLSDAQLRRDLDSTWFISAETSGVRSARRFYADYGVLVRCTNPFAPKRTLIMMAGLYGFGTWRAAQLAEDDWFLQCCADLKNFECLFRVEVHQDQLLTSSILVLRPLPERPDLSRRVEIGRPLPEGFRFGSLPPYGPAESPQDPTIHDESGR